MQRNPLLLLCALLVMSAAPIPLRAQAFGQFGPLESHNSAAMSLGAFFSGGGDQLTPTFEFRQGMRRGGSLGIQASVESQVLGAQVDFRRALANTGGSLALDLGGSVAGGLLTGNGSSAVFAEIVPTASRQWRVGGHGDQTLAGWTGAGLRVASGPSREGTNGVFRLGSRFGFSPEFGLVVHYENVGGGDRIFLGADYRFGGLARR